MTRKKTPTAIQEAKGVYKIHPERRNHDEPKPASGLPWIPDDVASDPVAEDMWYRTCATLDDMRILSTSDYVVIAIYAKAYAQYRTALAKVEQLGQAVVQKNKHGEVVIARNPFAVEMHKAADRLIVLGAELGLTPAARAKLTVNKDTKEHSAFEEWLARSG